MKTKITVFAFIATSIALAQPTPAFEVAVIKPATIEGLQAAQRAGQQPHAGVTVDNNRLDMGFQSLSDIIARAYAVIPAQLVGPDSLKTDRYDILAKLPAGANEDQVPQMLQALLAERFGMKIHREKRETAIYALVVSKGGLNSKKMKPATTPELAPEPQPGSVPVPTPEADLRLYQNALATTVRTLQSAGKQVILVDDAPSFALNPILLVRAAHIPARNALARTLTHPAGTIQIDPGFSLPESSPAIAAAQDLLRQLSRQLPVQLFDPKPFLCPTPTHCNYRDGETLLFIDSTHLSNAGATRALASFPLPPLTR